MRGFEAIAKEYDKGRRGESIEFWAEETARLAGLDDGSLVLDLGCGTGKHSIFLAQEGFSVYATDMSGTGIEIARKKAESLGLSGIHFKQHDMIGIPFTDNFFDVAICIWTIYHGTLGRIQETINEIYRVLKPGGMVLTDFLSVNDETYGLGGEIEKNTFKDIGGYTFKDVPLVHFSNLNEISELYKRFKLEFVEEHFTKRYCPYENEQGASFDIIARKRKEGKQ